ncbi:MULTISPECIES: acetyl-CoA carboxylase biotin carboxyl carrier protein subunit [Pseudomonas]|jgi:acetyl-CoA carboxylase biotin carboxyl carrier protein|uniref:Acetyl-CoA carboxylase biotin carboxyl carrier protein subunit n=1 Tax=Pseudomonas fragi TaxID=296 RepID=A0A9Q5B215_PSEFR|nr:MULTISPECIES: acetyl-CoA carboxylase biotin carboxyl carrier protein subunit [Pseudomonas]AOA05050.1 acetyl-CoA carboxylase biotin carboxyl carrier protein subunit [Pseudomonas sp. TMW 2.1634]MBM1198367.1 acetyl-CoA carboxylase biotin carboxyl carrier protein subunit [Pseudomonas fragi]NNA83922.1 acetyl-CoA carboxylase biotin carboxyl carrier protein subunit [Pseudomonas fragi]NNB12486.1 acetyl-CoA carboxylase biotin carboxyl carrier protein subunit [Pseudomonas fragi]NNB16348.1 acetyl-CoA 
MSEIKAPMAGNIWKINVQVGQEINFGDEVIIMESMKMEIPVEADDTGIVKEIRVSENDNVDDGHILIILQ